MTNFRLGMGQWPKKTPAGSTPAGDPHGLNEPEKFELKAVSQWDIFDLWCFIIAQPGIMAKGLPRKGSKDTARLKALVARVGIRTAKAVGEFYGCNWKRLYERLGWNQPASPSQFAYEFEKIAYRMKVGFKG